MLMYAPPNFADVNVTKRSLDAIINSPSNSPFMSPSSSPLMSWTTEESEAMTSSPSSDEDFFVTPSAGCAGREDWEALLGDLDMQPFALTSSGLTHGLEEGSRRYYEPNGNDALAPLDPFSMPTEAELLASTTACSTSSPTDPPPLLTTAGTLEPAETAIRASKLAVILPSTAKPSVPLTPVASPPDKIMTEAESEVAKIQRRRSQIATSVQRHREKKRQHRESLKQEFVELSAYLKLLQRQCKQRHTDEERVVARGEEEVTEERRKRHHSEALNQSLKKALFEQTSFLMGMRSITSNMPAPREMHIHDWLHSYTVLSAGDEAARRKEYLSYFNDCKMDMALKLILRETDGLVPRLSLANPSFAQVRIVYDGTDCGYDVEEMFVPRELRQEEAFVVPGTGQLVKKLTSVFLFQEHSGFTFDKFFEATVNATKQVGIYWPSSGWMPEALDVLDLEDSSRMSYSNFHGSMTIHDDRVVPSGEDVAVETRMLSRTKKWEDEAVIAWDYADRDEMYPITGDRSIRRDMCGAVVIRREGNGLISYRSVSIKIFAPTDLQATIDDNDRALIQRRIYLQSGELEAAKNKCLLSVYHSLAASSAEAV
ncbi:hypothetical protein Poli38472_010952 [Pythium oligandrum]|uniref:BZIP domain-containing protein n=1 Tax=Pythium oligandrum TaxID=41045 RepID=A0A8K1FIA9_PYTOL|nr:hypothetical protein Poli38472_010952 [Pythium oligandrum]|eukprot:TMW61889.1 hypothetical protein Poli38472_010952 [Pythium oligandrum]